MTVLIGVSDEMIAHAVVTARKPVNQILLEVRSALEQLGGKRAVQVSILGEDIARWTAQSIDRLDGYTARLLPDYSDTASLRPNHISRIFIERTTRV